MVIDMLFKKIYIEITNICNLDCLFCPKNNRPTQFMEVNAFKQILNKVKPFTKYLYFHLMGEPLMHPEINKLIDLASTDFKVNITTNGYLINRIKDNNHIHQINISLHSYDPKYQISLVKYLDNIFETVDVLLTKNTIVNLRFWTNNKYEQDILKYITKKYQTKINGNTKIKANLFFNYDQEFIWPDIKNNYQNANGSCQGLRTHIGILVDGSIVPCCLDYNGSLTLGNIFKDDLINVLHNERASTMRNGFLNNKKIEKMCQHCNFYDRICCTKEK
jgi:radical SAM protein with 4Fe4S-binding SPASM domain